MAYWIKFSIILLLLHVNTVSAQQSFDIEASVNEKGTVTATCQLQYTNSSAKNMDTLVFHLWANAYKNNRSPYIQQMIANGSSEVYFAKPAEKGGYTSLKMSHQATELPIIFKNDDEEIAYVALPTPLLPGQSTTIIIMYELGLPHLYDRLGQNNTHVYLTHWIPRPAVNENGEWKTMHYLGYGELYQDFADYHVNMAYPATWTCQREKPTSSDKLKTLAFSTKNSVDCALFFHKDTSQIVETTVNLTKPVTVRILAKKDDIIWQQASTLTEGILRFYHSIFKDFPFDTLHIIEGASDLNSGMEYVGSIAINGYKDVHMLEYYLAHEIAHQYFFAALANNERTEPYLDEGMATYLEGRYWQQKYGTYYYNQRFKTILIDEPDKQALQTLHQYRQGQGFNRPVQCPVAQQSAIEYGFTNYPAASRIFEHLAQYVGLTPWDNFLATFYQKHAFHHISFGLLQGELDQHFHKDFSWLTPLLASSKPEDYHLLDANKTAEATSITIANTGDVARPVYITYQENGQPKGQWVEGFVGQKTLSLPPSTSEVQVDPHQWSTDFNRSNNQGFQFTPHFAHPFTPDKKGHFNIAPALGYNTSDKLMAGVCMYNGLLDPKRFHFVLSPMYSFSQKEVVGFGNVGYTKVFDKSRYQKWTTSLDLKRYHFDDDKAYLKWALKTELYVKPKSLSDKYQRLSLAYMNIKEDFIEYGIDDYYRRVKLQNQLVRLNYEKYSETALQKRKTFASLEYSNYNVPYNQSHHYLKATASKTYAFAYKKASFISFRLWASYFLMNDNRRTNAYNNVLVKGSISLHSNATADYAYDENFIDRKQVWSSLQQIGTQGAGFKVPINSGYQYFGNSNDLAYALNTSVDLPFKIFNTTWSVYFDIGRYQQYLNNTKSVEQIWNGGISLNFKEVFFVNLPIIKSDAYKGVAQSGPSISCALNLDFLRRFSYYNY